MIFQFITIILAAGWVTLCVVFASLAVAVVLGLAVAFAKLSTRHLLRWMASIYIFVMRSIPDIVLIVLIYYSLPILLHWQMGFFGMDIWIEIPTMLSGITALGLIFSAHMAETFRKALINIPEEKIDGAIAHDLTPRRIFICIILVQFVRRALPGFTNNWLLLINASPLISLIALPDVMFRATQAAIGMDMPFTFYLVAAGFYLALSLASLVVLRLIARRFEISTREIMP